MWLLRKLRIKYKNFAILHQNEIFLEIIVESLLKHGPRSVYVSAVARWERVMLSSRRIILIVFQSVFLNQNKKRHERHIAQG